MSSRSLRLTRRGWVAVVVGLLVVATATAAVIVRLPDGAPVAGEPTASSAPETVAPTPRTAGFTPPEPDRWQPVVAAALPDDPYASLRDPTASSQDPGVGSLASLVRTAPIVVTAPVGDADATARATGLAAELRAPFVPGRPRAGTGGVAALADPGLGSAVTTWDTTLVVAVGDVAVPPGVEVRRWTRGEAPAAVVSLRAQASSDAAPAPRSVALRRGTTEPSVRERAAAGALGVDLVTVADPFALDEAARAALDGAERIHLLGSRDDWSDVDPATLSWHLEVVAAGHELPGGGYRIFPDRRLVALYGHPEGGALGLLGEQPVDEAIVRAQEHAAPYAELSDVPVIPAFEIIATIASAGAGSRGDYSRRTPVEKLRPWVDAAGEAGYFVVLDLQPGRADFLSQAEEYEELLREPHVGLALDPEWRLQPDEVHLRQIGSVGIEEVNQVATWLADLTRDNALPQKLFVLHQFRLSMIRDRDQLDTSRPELSYLVHVDGQGGQPAKDATYRALTTLDPPPGVWWGWKNFYDEDIPGLRSPADTLAVDPTPDLITFQ